MSAHGSKANGAAGASELSPVLLDSQLDSPLLAIEDVAELLKVPVSWVYERTRRRSSDRIPGFRLGKYWRFRRGEIIAWLERQRTGENPNA
jgi:excisionase family DNA binding protein